MVIHMVAVRMKYFIYLLVGGFSFLSCVMILCPAFYRSIYPIQALLMGSGSSGQRMGSPQLMLHCKTESRHFSLRISHLIASNSLISDLIPTKQAIVVYSASHLSYRKKSAGPTM